MSKVKLLNAGIPISVSLNDTIANESLRPPAGENKQRILKISVYAVAVGICISLLAKVLLLLINFVTNLFFFHRFSLMGASPSGNTLGLIVIIVPAIGGVVVGLMALYGSKAIRGHGIPEAMEQILTNQSRIKPTITYLKPISSAIAIGTGGPFGAEGPIIATGGALGSTLGQFLRITHNERKILLAAGATAGMSAIFGSPIAAIFLAIELLLFEFSPRSIIPVALACITGAAGHHFLFSSGPVFEMKELIPMPSNAALFAYSIIGIVIGGLSVLVTKCVYFIEDLFEKLPIHWMWWPALGGLAVGIIGYFAPRTMGVGYENISDILGGSMPIQIVLSLCILKFVSWAIALGSGTSGGTLAPLLTIGGATGLLAGTAALYLFPNSGITLPLAALVGMSAMFAGASRALLTSIVFALETTAQSNALLPLLAACTASYFISFLFMENTIMTEKIVRRGIRTPASYEPDILEKVTVGEVIKENKIVLCEDNTIGETREWLNRPGTHYDNYLVVANAQKEFMGIVSTSDLLSSRSDSAKMITSIIKQSTAPILMNDTLRTAIELMASANTDVLPVVHDEDSKTMEGTLSFRDI
ncbi:MAG TPA: chloride channel protein, partial [Chitinophagaceae bacterium]|nr:chloride channel protein [Chitinophagaceae bacterium]